MNFLRWLFPGKQWLPDEMSKAVVRNAVIGGFLDIVVWAHECKGEGMDSGLLASVAMHGHLAVVKYIHFNQLQPGLGQYPKTAIIHAAMNGDVETLAWLIDKGYPWSSGVCMTLARKGHLAALKYARSQGYPSGVLKITGVVPVVDEETLQFLVEAGCAP